MRCGSLIGNEIAEPEAVTANDLARLATHGLAKDRSVKHKGVEFAILAAGVAAGRQFGEQLLIDHPPGKTRIQLLRIDADDHRPEPLRDETADRHRRIALPHGIQSRHSTLREEAIPP